jgi:large subunit ribosomal protein L13
MAKKADIQPKWHVIDASGRVLGRVAAEAATILRGKHTPKYTPHVDTGDYVIIINAAKAVLTGKKLLQKEYIRHTGWIGGLKRVKYEKLMAENPEKAFELAIGGMLPHNTLGREQFKKLFVYAGAEHKHAAQVNASEPKPKAEKKAAKKPSKKAEVAEKPAVKADVAKKEVAEKAKPTEKAAKAEKTVAAKETKPKTEKKTESAKKADAKPAAKATKAEAKPADKKDDAKAATKKEEADA